MVRQGAWRSRSLRDSQVRTICSRPGCGDRKASTVRRVAARRTEGRPRAVEVAHRRASTAHVPSIRSRMVARQPCRRAEATLLRGNRLHVDRHGRRGLGRGAPQGAQGDGSRTEQFARASRGADGPGWRTDCADGRLAAGHSAGAVGIRWRLRAANRSGHQPLRLYAGRQDPQRAAQDVPGPSSGTLEAARNVRLRCSAWRPWRRRPHLWRTDAVRAKLLSDQHAATPARQIPGCIARACPGACNNKQRSGYSSGSVGSRNATGSNIAADGRQSCAASVSGRRADDEGFIVGSIDAD